MSLTEETSTFHSKASEPPPSPAALEPQLSPVRSGRSSALDNTDQQFQVSKKRPRENDPSLNLRGDEQCMHREYRLAALMPATAAATTCDDQISSSLNSPGAFQLSLGPCNSTNETVSRPRSDASFAHGLSPFSTPYIPCEADLGLGNRFREILSSHGENTLPSQKNMDGLSTAIFSPHSQKPTGIQMESPSHSLAYCRVIESKSPTLLKNGVLNNDMMKSRLFSVIPDTSCTAEEPFTNERIICGDRKPGGQNQAMVPVLQNLQAGDLQAGSLSQTNPNSDIFSRILASSSSPAAQIADSFHLTMDQNPQKHNASIESLQMTFMKSAQHLRRPQRYTGFSDDQSYGDSGRGQKSSSRQEMPYPFKQSIQSGISFSPAEIRGSVVIPTIKGMVSPTAYLTFHNASETRNYIGRQNGLSGFQPATAMQQGVSVTVPKPMISREVSESIGALLQKPFESEAAPSVTVVKEGRAIGRGICLQDYHSYEGLARALRDSFGTEVTLGSSSSESPFGLETAVPGYRVAYEDSDGDLLLAGDLSWKEFVRAAKRIRLLPTSSS